MILLSYHYLTLITEVEFVINNVQNNFYKSFKEDSKELKREVEKVLNVVNSLTIIIGIGFVGFSLLWMIIKIQMIYKVIIFNEKKLLKYLVLSFILYIFALYSIVVLY